MLGINIKRRHLHQYESAWSLLQKLSQWNLVPASAILQRLPGFGEPFQGASKLDAVVAAVSGFTGMTSKYCRFLWADAYLPAGCHAPHALARLLVPELRFCQECIDHGFHSVAHQLAWTDRCIWHDCQLICACKSCGKANNWWIDKLTSSYRGNPGFTCSNCSTPFVSVGVSWMNNGKPKEEKEKFNNFLERAANLSRVEVAVATETAFENNRKHYAALHSPDVIMRALSTFSDVPFESLYVSEKSTYVREIVCISEFSEKISETFVHFGVYRLIDAYSLWRGPYPTGNLYAALIERAIYKIFRVQTGRVEIPEFLRAVKPGRLNLESLSQTLLKPGCRLSHAMECVMAQFLHIRGNLPDRAEAFDAVEIALWCQSAGLVRLGSTWRGELNMMTYRTQPMSGRLFPPDMWIEPGFERFLKRMLIVRMKSVWMEACATSSRLTMASWLPKSSHDPFVVIGQVQKSGSRVLKAVFAKRVKFEFGACETAAMCGALMKKAVCNRNGQSQPA